MIDVKTELVQITKTHTGGAARLRAIAALAKRLTTAKSLATRLTAAKDGVVLFRKAAAPSALDRIQGQVQRLRKGDTALSEAEALDHVCTQDPALYGQYQAEQAQARGGDTTRAFATLVEAAVAQGTPLEAAYVAVAKEHPALYNAYQSSFALHA